VLCAVNAHETCARLYNVGLSSCSLGDLLRADLLGVLLRADLPGTVLLGYFNLTNLVEEEV